MEGQDKSAPAKNVDAYWCSVFAPALSICPPAKTAKLGLVAF
jgi:hypothetical protein